MTEGRRLHYNYFRDYDPSTGKYVQSDPIGLAGGINTYLYADADPISKVDPKGLNPAAAVRGAWWVGTRIGGAINYGVGAATGASIGSLIYDLCNDDSEDKCKKVREDCRRKCTDEQLPSPWWDTQSTGYHKCYSDCVYDGGC